MNKEEIEEYLKRVDELGAKLTGKDKETYAWLIYGYNQCAKSLNETEQQLHEASLTIQEMTEQDIECPSNCEKLEKLQQENKQLKDNWNKLREVIRKKQDYYRYVKDNRYRKFLSELLDKMQEIEQGNDD